MILTSENLAIDFDKIPISEYWNDHNERESRMHKIHAYPAKFPAFIVSKSLGYARDKDLNVDSIADVFCGCGTTALEAKQYGVDFWGCDINPVATLIARVKSQAYSLDRLNSVKDEIIQKIHTSDIEPPESILNHGRINYWFEQEQIIDLYRLLSAIKETPRGKYRDFFLCAFSNILKPTSRWLTKSIKPQIDPNKERKEALSCFKIQVDNMIKGVGDVKDKIPSKSKTKIETQNFLKKRVNTPFTDLLVTSPPYVTSYEYADLHQLSTLWLGFTEDYRELREGTIGSLHHKNISTKDLDSINHIGKNIYMGLKKKQPLKARSALKYFIDIDKAISKSYSIVNPGGMVVFVIGNTKYSGVKVDNAKFLTKCMLDAGFEQLEVVKRKVSSKILTPYRDSKGKFSRDKRKRKVYGSEFIVIGRKTQNG
ncbi:MAG: class I SAM-dependent methyltransferase [Ekhidna sp.]